MVRHVVVDGRPVVVDGDIVGTDRNDLRARIAEAWQATRRRMEDPR
jgi:hypothetical protein